MTEEEHDDLIDEVDKLNNRVLDLLAEIGQVRKENVALREIVQQVAHHGEYDNWACIFGGDCEPQWNALMNDYDHAIDCFVSKARAILEKSGG